MIIQFGDFARGARVIGKIFYKILYTTLIQNMDLVIFFLFLHMLKGTMMLHFNVFVSIAITFYYMPGNTRRFKIIL